MPSILKKAKANILPENNSVLWKIPLLESFPSTYAIIRTIKTRKMYSSPWCPLSAFIDIVELWTSNVGKAPKALSLTYGSLPFHDGGQRLQTRSSFVGRLFFL